MRNRPPTPPAPDSGRPHEFYEIEPGEMLARRFQCRQCLGIIEFAPSMTDPGQCWTNLGMSRHDCVVLDVNENNHMQLHPPLGAALSKPITQFSTAEFLEMRDGLRRAAQGRFLMRLYDKQRREVDQRWEREAITRLDRMARDLQAARAPAQKRWKRDSKIHFDLDEV